MVGWTWDKEDVGQSIQYTRHYCEIHSGAMFEGSLIMSTTAAGRSVCPFQKIGFLCALHMFTYVTLI